MVDLIPHKIPVSATLSYCGYPTFGRGMPLVLNWEMYIHPTGEPLWLVLLCGRGR
jgi:hypothetical protein